MLYWGWTEVGNDGTIFISQHHLEYAIEVMATCDNAMWVKA